MPVGFVPKKSPAHRLACRGLYKALLSACNDFATKPATGSNLSSTFKSLVRYRYARDTKLQNPQQIQDALVYGRNSLHTLRLAVSGDEAALDTLKQTVAALLARVKIKSETQAHMNKDLGSYAPHVLKKKEYIKWVTDPKTYLPGPKTIKIWDRPAPLERLEGKPRKVPVYFITQGIPFLRYYKKQPYRLSLYIRGQIRRTEKHWNQLATMEYLNDLGRLEDKWDALLHETGLVRDEDVMAREGPEKVHGRSWADAAYRERGRYGRMIEEDDRKRYEDGKRLMDIHFAEKRLAEKELIERHKVEQAAARAASEA